jgi:hypothetical protein
LDDARTLVLLSPQVFVGLEDGVGVGLACSAVPFVNGLVLQHRELVPHELQVEVHHAQVPLAANQQIFISIDDVAALFEHGSQHVQRTV